MCGIVGAIAERNVSEILIEGLKRLEYRGYDSAGLALIDDTKKLIRDRQVGKVAMLADSVHAADHKGFIGIAHTRWATHGAPSVANAHPHSSGHIAVVHNGIIENYSSLRTELENQGYTFSSQTDTEVLPHLIERAYKTAPTLQAAVEAVIPLLDGAYALGVISSHHPDEIIAVRAGSPLVVGFGIGENFISSDQMALLPVTNRFMYLEENDVVHLTREKVSVFRQGKLINLSITELDAQEVNAEKGPYKHYMLKEIYEQPEAVSRTLSVGLTDTSLRAEFLANGVDLLKPIKQVQILACGTSYHSGMIAKYWFERIARIPCQVEIASEFRYRSPVVCANTLILCISQSGETADTLAALRDIKANSNSSDKLVYLSICNVPTATLIRESDISLVTQAGPEIGVASTKAFTTQLVALFLLMLKTGRVKETITLSQEQEFTKQLWHLPSALNEAITADKAIYALSKLFVDKNHALFLGRGIQFPIALEGALKLKEISYIHAEGYAAGELKHGPLALVDSEMPIVVLAPMDDMLDKLKSNMQEVMARGGELFVFADVNSGVIAEERQHVVYIPAIADELSPIVYSIPMQLLSYHIAVLRGTDVDQPRNLAKSVTVE